MRFVRPYQGLLTAMVTPFRADGEVNDEAAVALGRYLLQHGSDGLVVAGTTGEGATLSDEELTELVRLIAGELGSEGSVVAGAGTNDTRHAVQLTEAVIEAGAQAVLSVTPGSAPTAPPAMPGPGPTDDRNRPSTEPPKLSSGDPLAG